MNKFWKIQDAVDSDGSELILEGAVASESWFGDEVTPQAFRDELKEVQGNLTVVINSPGGDVFAGVQIYNALKNRGNVTVRVDGLAASIASIIAMAGDKIIMSQGSLMMVHKPSMMTWGDSNDMVKAKEVLDTIEAELLDIYVSRTGQTIEKITELVNNETWFGGKQAVELGFADVAKEEKSSISDTIKNMLGGKLAFSNTATKESLEAFTKKVNMETEDKSVEATEVVEVVEVPVAAEVVETETTPEEVTEVEAPVAEAKVETTITNKTKETPKMENTTDVAVENIVAKPVQEANVDSVVADYLKTNKSIEDYARHLEKHAGEKGEAVQDSWRDHLVTMGVTNPEVLLPVPLIEEIQDAFAAGGEIFNLVNWTGLDAYNTAWDTVTGEDSRGKGYNRALDANKAEEVITLADRIIRPQFIYKYITLNREDVKMQRSTGALVRYVLSELPRRIIREVERAFIVGDGRLPGTKYKINESSNGGIFSIATDAANAAVPFAVEYTAPANQSVYETLIRARALVTAPGRKFLIAKQEFVTQLQLLQVNGTYLFAPGADVASALGFAGVITPDWLNGTSSPVNDAFIVTDGTMKGVGDRSIEAFQNFMLSTNKNEYLQELWAGGGLSVANSAVAIATWEVSS